MRTVPMTNIAELLSEDFASRLFSSKMRLIPNLDELYELELAFHESQILSDSEIIRNGAYFAQLDDAYTHHFLMCTGHSLKLPRHSSARLKSFFEKNIFRTGYATHGLFPYRGKFHPQMVKAIINIIGIKPGDTVLDPMVGSGTVSVESVLMGANTIGIDSSPFCRFMAQTKIDALTMSLQRSRKAAEDVGMVFNYFANRVGGAVRKPKASGGWKAEPAMTMMEESARYVASAEQDVVSETERSTAETYNFLLLAYLDSVGYSERSRRAGPKEQFGAILQRYLFVTEKIQAYLRRGSNSMGTARIVEADAREMPLEDASVDGIVFSPPYSFAIDYLRNDEFHLRALGADLGELRDRMVGVRGRGLADKFEKYKADMSRVLGECARVLKVGRVCCLVVGTNSNQLSKVLGVPPEDVEGLHEILAERAGEHGLKLVKEISRPITGIANTMRREYIVLLQRR